MHASFVCKWLFLQILLTVVNVCRVVEDGVKTVTVEENGVLKSKTVNGEAQAITYRK